MLAGCYCSGLAATVVAAEPASDFAPPVRLQSEGRDIDTGEVWGHSGPALADIDGDGRRELVVGDFSGKFRVFPNVGTEAEPKWGPQTYLMAGGEEAKVWIYCCIGSSPFFVDYDGDGVVDMLSGSYDPGKVYLFRGLGKGKFATRETVEGADGKPVLRVPDQQQTYQSFGSWPVMVDWDADGDLDLLVGGFDGTMFVRINEGTRERPLLSATNLQVMTSDAKLEVPGKHAAPAVTDWDGDERWDILSGSEDGGVYWFRNVGPPESPKFAEAELLLPKHEGSGYGELMEPAAEPIPGIRTQIAATDYNHDGKTDLLVGDFRTTITIRGDLSDEERTEFERIQQEREALFKESRDAMDKLQKSFREEYPGDAAFTDEGDKAWQELYTAFRDSEPQSARKIKGEALAKQLEPFLLPTNSRDSDDNAKSHGYVWLYLRN